MSASQSGVFSLQEFSDAGALLVGGRLYTYVNGTTTQKTAYTDAAGSVAHTYTSDGLGGQYIALNSRGELPAPLFLTPGAYDISLKRADGSSIWTRYAISVTDAAASIVSVLGVSADSKGASGDGATVNDSAIASAISTAGQGGVVNFTAGGVYLHASPIVHGGTTLNLNGATLKYTGNAQQITGPGTGTSAYGGVINGILDSTASTCTQVIQVRSGFNCKYRDLVLKVNSTTATALDLVCNTTGTGDPAEGTLNTVGCLFENITVVGTIGRVFRLFGNISAGTVLQAVTLNNFFNCQHYGNCTIIGLDEAAACDNNYFSGETRVECNAAGSIGRVTNSSNPGGNAGVYANSSDTFAVDTFGSAGGRIGWKLNFSKDTYCGSFFQGPAAELGQIVNNGALSFDITLKETGGTNYSSKHLLGHNLGVGTLALPNVGCLVSFPATTGASQYGTQSLIGPDATVVTAAAQVGQVSTLAQAYTVPIAIGFFAPPAIKGAGSTITSDYGFYAQDRSAGNSNFGFYGTLSVGFGKWQFYGAGTAASQLNGLLSVTGFAQLGKTVVNNNAATTYSVTMGFSVASTSYVAFTGTNAASIAFTFSNAALVPDGWRLDIYTQAAVATVTWASTGATFVGAPAALGAGSVTRFIFHAATNQWLPA